MPNINSLLVQSIMACRKGRYLPVPLAEQDGNVSCRKLTESVINNSLSPADQEVYKTIIHLIGLGTNLRRQTLFIDSREAFRTASEYLHKNAKSDLLQVLGTARIAQAESELDFQLKNYRLAQDSILKSLQNYRLLEQEHTLSFLHINRLQQVLLWLRTCMETGAEEQAVYLAQQAITYLCGYGEQLSIGKGWSSSLVQAIPEPSRYALIAQFASEVGCMLSRQAHRQAGELFDQFSAWEYFDGHGYLQEIYAWGRLKKAYLKQDFQSFLTYCIPFLESGRKETLLWDTTVLDLCRCCKTLRPRQTVDFLEDVSKNTSQMWDIPPGGYSLPTEIYYKRIFVIKEHSFPAFVLPNELRCLLENVADGPVNKTKSPGRIERRFHAYNVGLPRSGCSSVMALFGNYKSIAEYKERESVELITAWKDGWINEETLRSYIRYRHEIGQLEMDTASFNHFYLHILIKEFPQAKFIFTVRDCYTWVNSFLKMISRWKKHFLDIGQDMPDWMLNYGRILFGEYDWQWFNSYEDLQEHLDPLVEMFIKSWAEYNSRVLNILPPERSIIIRTSEISCSQAKLADFVGVPTDSITENHHINIAPDKIDLLKDFDREKFDAICLKYGHKVIDRTELNNCY